MARLKALIWDVDGTLAETERDGHRIAFNMAFEECAVPWRWDEERYGALLEITGGRERLMFDLGQRADAPPLGQRDAWVREVHLRKNRFYADLVGEGRIALRPGVLPLMLQCREHNVRMAIATTTSRDNLQALLQVHLGTRWADWFAIAICGEDVQAKKPDPEVYRKALRALGIDPLTAVAIEDAPAGVAAARAADVPVVVTRSAYFARAPIEGAIAVGPGLNTRHKWRPCARAGADPACPIGLDDIEDWCAQMASSSI